MQKQGFLSTILFIVYTINFSLFGQEAQFPLEEVAISDNIHVFDSTLKASLSKECKDFYRDKKIQIEIVLIPVAWLGKLSLEQYSLQLAEKRKLGNKELDSGILVLIVGSPKDTLGRGVRIEVGYGLEDKLTDSKAQKIIDNYIITYLKTGKYYEACHWGLWDIKKALEDFDNNTENSTHSDNVEDKNTEEEDKKAEIPWFYFALSTMIILFVIYSLGLASPKPRFFTSLVVYPACTALNYLVTYITMPIVLHTILFLLFSLFIPALMLYAIKIRYPNDEDKILSLNGLGVMMYLLTVVFLMIVGFYYQSMDNIGFFLGTVLSLFLSIPLLILAEIAELEGGGGNFNSGSGGSYSSGSNSGSSSNGGGYSGGSNSGSSSNGGGYSGGGGSFGGGGASSDW